MIKKLIKTFNKIKYRLFEDNRVGIIKLEGIILDTGPLPVASRLIEALDNAKKQGIKNIVIRINSPGGTVGASQEIYRELERYRKDGFRIVASLGDLAASGGLYVAVGADKIVSNPGTVTGSIGVIIKSSVVKSLYKKIGIDSQTVKSGQYKDILSNTKYLSKDEKEILQELIDSTYEDFIKKISENRKIDIKEVKKFSDGRIFSGKQAKKLGLIDKIGSQADAVDIIAKMAGMRGKPTTVNITSKKTFLQKITGSNLYEILENAGVNAFYKRVPLWLMPDF